MKTFSEEVERYKSMSLLIIFEIGVLPVGPKIFGTWTGATPSQGGAMDGKDLHDLGHLTSPLVVTLTGCFVAERCLMNAT